MQQNLFKALAKLNKTILPSFSKQQLDLSKATKLQLAIIGWRVYVTRHALGQTAAKRKGAQLYIKKFQVCKTRYLAVFVKYF